MDAISSNIQLAHDHDMRPIRWLSDWHVDARRNFVFYRPLGLGFAVWNAVEATTEPAPTHYAARLVHICDGGNVPEWEPLVQLGKDAIHAFMLGTVATDWQFTPHDHLDASDVESNDDIDPMDRELNETDFRGWPDYVPSLPNDFDDEVPF